MRSRHATTRVGLLLVSELTGSSREMCGPYRRVFAEMFDGHAVEFTEIPLYAGATPGSLDDADLWIINGSPDSVYDDLPWLTTAEEIVRDAAATERPLFGICFGHQLVARALGGRVERAAGGWQVGVIDYRTVAPVPAWPDAPAELALLAVHQDQVVEVPADTVVWSTADGCPNAGLVIGERMWTVQGHPEFGTEICAALYEQRRDLIGSARTDAALASLDRPLSNRHVAAAVIAGT
mgnify:CR=1 FL=1